MDLREASGRHQSLEALIVLAAAILTVLSYLIVTGPGLQEDAATTVIAMLIIVLIGVEMVRAVIDLRELEAIKDGD